MKEKQRTLLLLDKLEFRVASAELCQSCCA